MLGGAERRERGHSYGRRGGKVCLAAFSHEETPVDVAHIVRNNIYLYGIRGVAVARVAAE